MRRVFAVGLEIVAPIDFRQVMRSSISGSRATFSRIVSPLAAVAAIKRFSVPPTEGKGKRICVPFNPFGAEACMRC